ncbi:MAG: hypothetical protein IJ756_05530 [Paludibacteraceae bacterium]|nr:hypothetical protein [Paludibacteraceae bacterium]
MSLLKLETPFTSFRGKICKHTQIIYKEMYGTKFTSQICHPRATPYTTAEIARQTKFKQAAEATKKILAAPEQRATSVEAFKAQKNTAHFGDSYKPKSMPNSKH